MTNHHKGNKRFRDIVALHRPDYVRAPKIQKPSVARVIVRAIRNGDPPGRFIRKDEKSGKWIDIGDKKAAEKTSQALREKTNEEREKIRKEPGAAGSTAAGISLLPGTTDLLAAAGAMMAGVPPAQNNVVMAKSGEKEEEQKESAESKEEENPAALKTEGEEEKNDEKKEEPKDAVDTVTVADPIKEAEAMKDPVSDIPAEPVVEADGDAMEVEKSTEEMAAEAENVHEV